MTAGQEIEVTVTLNFVSEEMAHDWSVVAYAPNGAVHVTHKKGYESSTLPIIFFIFPKVPPKWIQEPRDIQAVVGQDITLPCLVEGFPKPSTVWTRTNGKKNTILIYFYIS